MKKTLYPLLVLAAVAALALPAAAADLAAPVCSDAAAPAAGAAAPTPAPAEAGEAAEPLMLGGPIVPAPQQCGLVTCPVGTRCCNPLCSACTPPGVECTLGDCGHGPTS